MNEDTRPLAEDPRRNEDLGALLRAAGARPQPPPELAGAVRAAVEAEWRAVVAARRPQRRLAPWLAAAGLGAVAIATTIVATRVRLTTDVATVTRVEGSADVRRGAQGSWEPIARGTVVRAEDAVRTRSASRMALSRKDGLEVRLDVNAALAFDGASRARLENGRVYVDAGRGDTAAKAFSLETSLGAVRHVGTQYSVRLTPAELNVAVREGSVEIQRGSEPVVAEAGELVSIMRDGSIRRDSVTRFGDSWHWAEAVGPGFMIEGRSLDEYLTWSARETGRRLVYASSAAAREAETTHLKGSVDGMNPDAALLAVVATAPSLRLSLTVDQLRIERAPDGDNR
jgi:ferric-dicitrate binding protein FerR (iron transport regulator)